LEPIDIEGKDITGDALLTQRDIAEYIVLRHGHYHFTVKQNQRGIFMDIVLYFENRGEPDYIDYGITCRTPDQAAPNRVLEINRGHWCIENSCHYILEWNFDEDRSPIHTGYGPENITRLRRFAISLIKSKGTRSVAQKMRRLAFNARAVFDYFRMTKNSCASADAN
jgi:predicted transposase YbfD/YdcC